MGFGIINLLTGDSFFWWTAFWQFWVFLMGLIALPVLREWEKTTLSAGPTWVRRQTVGLLGRSKDDWSINLYQIRRINVWRASDALPWNLQLTGEPGEGDQSLPLPAWQRDRRIWDLVYNGLLWSTTSNASINDRAWRELELDQVPSIVEWMNERNTPGSDA